jgi:hypothetical protein
MKKMRKMRKMRTRTTTGSKLAGLLLALLVVCAEPAVVAEKKPKKPSEASQPYSVIFGTVFRPPGFALPGAEIEIVPEAETKSKKLKTTSDSRGEFALRVPPVPMKYKVDVKRSGYQPQEQSVAIEGEQQKALTFQLEPAAK